MRLYMRRNLAQSQAHTDWSPVIRPLLALGWSAPTVLCLTPVTPASRPWHITCQFLWISRFPQIWHAPSPRGSDHTIPSAPPRHALSCLLQGMLSPCLPAQRKGQLFQEVFPVSTDEHSPRFLCRPCTLLVALLQHFFISSCYMTIILLNIKLCVHICYLREW